MHSRDKCMYCMYVTMYCILLYVQSINYFNNNNVCYVRKKWFRQSLASLAS